MKIQLAVLFFIGMSFQSLLAQAEGDVLSVTVYTANHYCGEEPLSETELEKHRNKHLLPNKVFYSINLSRRASGQISVNKWMANEAGVVEGDFETGEYLILDEEDFKKIVADVPEGEQFILTGNYLRTLSRNGSARMYVPTEPTGTIELVFWETCDGGND